MNLTEWILASAVVLLWLYAWSLSHRIGVLRGECSRWSNESEKEVRALRERMNKPSPWASQAGLVRVWSLTRDDIDLMNERLNKLDPPRRRSTDKEPCHKGPTADGYVKLETGCPHFNPCCKAKKAAKR